MHFCTCCSVVIDPAAPMAASRRTRFCTYCSQELSHAAYYRHLEDKSGSVCPGKRLLGAESDDSSASEAMPSDGESGQALQSSNDMAENSPMVTESFDETNMEVSDQEDSSDSDDSINGTEIWESSEDEEESQSSEQAQRILYGMALFLTKFQLFFKISERGMAALLLFLRILFTFLANIIKHPLLTEICQDLPLSMWKTKNITGMKHIEGVIDYVVCPKCHSIVSVTDCITIQNGKRVFLDKCCDFIEYPDHPHRSRRAKCNTSLMKRVKVKGTMKFVPRKLYQYHSIIASLIKELDIKEWVLN